MEKKSATRLRLFLQMSYYSFVVLFTLTSSLVLAVVSQTFVFGERALASSAVGSASLFTTSHEGHSHVAPMSSEPSSDIPEKREFPVDEAHSPCVNFHDYICSKVENAFKLREDRSSHVFAFNDSYERLLLKKREFLKNLKNDKNLSKRGEGLKNNFLACMDEKSGAREERIWVKQLQKELAEIKSIEALTAYLNAKIEKGQSNFLGLGETENLLEPTQYDFFVGANFMSLPDHSYYEKNELINAYQELMTDFFLILRPEQPKTTAQKKAKALMQFEKDFIKIYPLTDERRKRWSENRTITQADFLTKYPNLKLNALFKMIPEKTLIRLPIPESVAFYNEHLDAKNLNLLKDLLLWHSASDNMDDAYPAFFKKTFDFRHRFFGSPAKRPVREERCTMYVMSTFAKEMDEILMPRLFPSFPEEKFKKLVEKVRKTVVKGINKNSWLSDAARKEAADKMAHARLQLVKPLNDREWDFRPEVQYSSTHKIENMELLGAAEFKKMLQVISKPADHDKWAMGPLEINAYYSRESNKFVMPLGILQPPFYSIDGSEIENLGSVGAVVGHELGHGIDDIGSKFDQTGKLRSWMSEKDLKEFSARSKKLVEQFNKIGHNGELTLGENIGDLVGVTFAYDAAFSDGATATVENKRKFFESYARLWCGVYRPQYAEKYLKTNPHSLGWARINEPVKHLKGFSEAYQCKEGDPMFISEKDRISIWK